MANPSPIEHTDWSDGSTALRLEDGRISGTGGINRLMGDYTLDGSSLTLGPLATTMMAGPPEQMEREWRFLANLARVALWSADGDELVLCDSDSGELVRLARAESAVL